MNTNANFKVYQASAGSGKTFTLIKEYLKLCLKDKASVANYQSILAITFTNAAANEMKDKIVNNLCELAGVKPAKSDGMKQTLLKELDKTTEKGAERQRTGTVDLHYARLQQFLRQHH